MKILTRYTIKEILGPLLFGIFAFTTMLIGFLLIDLLKDAQQYHLSVWAIIKLLILRTPEYLMDAAPLSVLLAALLGLGNLTSHSETIAMRAGGLSFLRLAVPVLLVGAFISIGSIALNQFVVPLSLRVYEKTKNELYSNSSSAEITDFKKDFREGDVIKRVSADLYEPKKQELRKTIIVETNHGVISRTIEAEVMYWDGKSWFFKNGRISQFTGNNFYPIIVASGRMHYSLPITPTEIERYNETPEKKSITELYRYIQRDADKKDKQSLLVDFHLKMAMPFASLIFAMLGTPLALKPQRRTNAAGFGLCIIFILIWYVLMASGSYLGRGGILTPFLGAWLPNIILAGYSGYIFSKVKS